VARRSDRAPARAPAWFRATWTARTLALAVALAAVCAVACAPGDGGEGEREGGDGEREAEAGPRGRFKPARPQAAELAVDDGTHEALERLRSIGYVGGSVADSRGGVTRYDPALAQDGLNFYTSGHGPEAVLMDMDGTVLHRWRRAFDEVWPGSPDRDLLGATWWRRAHLYDDGGILAIFEGLGIVRLDRDSRVLWAESNGAHHDLDVAADGTIRVLTRVARRDHPAFPGTPILEDFLTFLDPDGAETRRVSLVDAFLRSGFRSFVDGRRHREGDIFHTNTVHVLDGRLAARSSAFGRGNVLTSMNGLGVVAVLDVETGTIVWARRQPPLGQHDPQIVDGDRLLYFDNREGSGASVVREIDPLTGTEHWSYRGTVERPFYSRYCGAVQRLPNGGTLVTESDSGRAFEVLPSGAIVWEFYNPHRAGAADELIATISDMQRIERRRAGWLER